MYGDRYKNHAKELSSWTIASDILLETQELRDSVIEVAISPMHGSQSSPPDDSQHIDHTLRDLKPIEWFAHNYYESYAIEKSIQLLPKAAEKRLMRLLEHSPRNPDGSICLEGQEDSVLQLDGCTGAERDRDRERMLIHLQDLVKVERIVASKDFLC